MALLICATLAISSGFAVVLMLSFILREFRTGHFPPRTISDAKVSIYAGLLLAVLSLISLVAKDAAFAAAANTEMPETLPSTQRPR